MNKSKLYTFRQERREECITTSVILLPKRQNFEYDAKETSDKLKLNDILQPTLLAIL